MASDSSDDDCKFDFAGLRKKKKKIAATRLAATSPESKKHKRVEVAKPVIDEVSLVVEADKPEDALKVLLEEAKAGKFRENPTQEDDDIEEIIEEVIEEEPIAKRSRKATKKTMEILETSNGDDLYNRIVQFETDFSLRQAAEQRDQLELMKKLVTTEVLEIQPHVNVALRIKFSDDFLRVFTVDYEEQFAEKVFLKYSLEAGFADPESFSVIWEHDDQIELIKFYETPKSKKMSTKEPVMLFYLPNEGTVREVRKEGELKLKFNVKGKEKPIEKYVHKNKAFGEVKEELMKELDLEEKQKIRFNFDCEKIPDDETPEGLDMEDLDLIDVVID